MENRSSFRILHGAAGCSLFFGLFHVPFLFLDEQAARYFTAPRPVLALIREHSPWLYLIVAAVVLVFGVAALYALSAAGTVRPLPGRRGMLALVATVYTLRGLVVVPQVLTLWRHPGALLPQMPVFSAIALVVGILHWVGYRQWRAGGAP